MYVLFSGDLDRNHINDYLTISKKIMRNRNFLIQRKGVVEMIQTKPKGINETFFLFDYDVQTTIIKEFEDFMLSVYDNATTVSKVEEPQIIKRFLNVNTCGMSEDDLLTLHHNISIIVNRLGWAFACRRRHVGRRKIGWPNFDTCVQTIIAEHKNGKSIRKIAAEQGISPTTVQRILKEHKE